LTELAKQATPADVVRQLVFLSHPDAARLLPLVATAQADLFGVERAVLVGFADRTVRLTARSDKVLREFVRLMLDVCNAQNALLLAGQPHDVDPAEGFVPGGRLSATLFVSAATARTRERALRILAAAFDRSPVARMLPVTPSDVAHLDRAFLTVVLQWLARTARLEPLSTAPVLRVLLLIEAQSRDMRALTWGAVLGAPPHLRKQQLVTPP
jgi:V/A-type H+-transporting ATPase subunit C